MRIEPTGRDAIIALAAERGETLANLSRLIGRGDRFLSNFIRSGRPAALPDLDRSLLAKYLGIPEDRLI